jgi:hypothetical protein
VNPSKEVTHPDPDLIQSFVDGQCPVADYGWVALHLGECGKCYFIYIEAATVILCKRLSGGGR